MTARHRAAFGSYAYLLALCRLRLVVAGDAMPRENEPISLMMLLVLR